MKSNQRKALTELLFLLNATIGSGTQDAAKWQRGQSMACRAAKLNAMVAFSRGVSRLDHQPQRPVPKGFPLFERCDDSNRAPPVQQWSRSADSTVAERIREWKGRK